MKYLLLLILLAPSLHLEASTTRSELVRGDRVTISAYLFNDSDAPHAGALGMQAPHGFTLITTRPSRNSVDARGNMQASWGYQVNSDAPAGLARFVVIQFDDAGFPVATREVVVRVGTSVPARRWRVFVARVTAN